MLKISLHYAKHFEANAFLKKILRLQFTHNLVSVTHTSISEQQRRFVIDISKKSPSTHVCSRTRTHTHTGSSLWNVKECQNCEFRLPSLLPKMALCLHSTLDLQTLKEKCLTFQRIIPTFPSHHWVVGIFLHIWRQGDGNWKWD